MSAFVLFVVGVVFLLCAMFANKTGAPHLLTYAIICFTGFAIILEINNKK